MRLYLLCGLCVYKVSQDITIMENNPDSHFVFKYVRMLLGFPYYLFANPVIPFFFVISGIFFGGKNYIIISIVAFGIHLIARKVFSNRLFDYPFSVTKTKKVKVPYLQGIMLSFVLGVFASSYLGIIDRSVSGAINAFFLEGFGYTFFKLLLFVGPFLILFLFWELIKGSQHETKLFFISLLLTVGMSVFLYSNVYGTINQSAIIGNKTYKQFIELLFGVPSLYVVKLLYVGFNEEDYQRYF